MCLAGHSITADELRNFLALFKMSSPAVVSFPRGWGSGVELDRGGGGGLGEGIARDVPAVQKPSLSLKQNDTIVARLLKIGETGNEVEQTNGSLRYTTWWGCRFRQCCYLGLTARPGTSPNVIIFLLRWVFMSLRMGTTCKYCLVGVKHNGNYTLLVNARATANVVFLVPLCLESFHFQVQKVHSPNLFK